MRSPHAPPLLQDSRLRILSPHLRDMMASGGSLTVVAAPAQCPGNSETILYIFLFQYLWGLPMLYMTMLAERKKRLYPKPAPKLQGVVFPITKKGDRSTTPTAKEVFGAALEVVDKQAADKVRKEKNWRFGYNKHIVNNLLVSARSEAAALKIAQAGIDAMYKSFDFISADGASCKFGDALEKGVNRFYTHTVVGKKPKPASGGKVRVPYKNYETGKMVNLEGAELTKQIDEWVEYGTIEPDCGDAIKQVVLNPGWCDLSGQYFVLLGATSAMGVSPAFLCGAAPAPHLFPRIRPSCGGLTATC